MLDIRNIEYRVVAVTEKGKRLNITKLVQDLGWEEPESELATRITCTFRNQRVSGERLSHILKPGILLIIYAVNNGIKTETARGYVTDWKVKRAMADRDLTVTAYDELYNMQKSQDNIYFSAGLSTESAIRQLFDKWGIQIGTYKGPSVTHGKLVFKNKSICDSVLEILADARKKGGKNCVIRSNKGKVDILPKCSNNTVYSFSGKNAEVVTYQKSTASMVTRVKIYGQADDDGNSKVEAVVDGDTKFGIRQKIQTKGKEETLEEAKKSAEDTLEEEGGTEKDITLEVPDVPYVRKGDAIYAKVGYLDGYYEVLSARHDADARTMTLGLKKTSSSSSSAGDSGKSKNGTYNVGDIVMYKGGTHYVSSYPGAAGYPAKPGKAKITAKDGSGKAHPWHLIHTDSESNVYGWVDDGTFEEVDNGK